MAEFLVIEIDEDGSDGLTHLCEAESWEAAVEDAKTEGRLEGVHGFRPGSTKVTDWMVRACRNDLAQKLGGFAPSDEDIRKIIAGDTETRRCLLGYGDVGEPGSTANGIAASMDRAGLDTYDREALLEAFATDFLESPFGWPRMMADKEESNHFIELIGIAVKDGRLKEIA